MKLTPHSARMYILLGAFLLALPALGKMHTGVTGKLLVAPSETRGGIFAGSVVFIARHNSYGAYGVIVNKPMAPADIKITFPNQNPELPVYTGGPVSDGGTPFVLGADKAGLAWFSWGGDGFIAPATGKKRKPENLSLYPKIIFSGYSGWMMFQLDRELLRQYWDVIDYDSDLVFNTPPEEMWRKARQRVMETKNIKDDTTI